MVAAVEEVTALPACQAAVLQWAPEIARFDPGSPGGLLGLDFHLTSDGPKLIEVNTNPGGALLNALLGQAQQICMPAVVRSPTDTAKAEERIWAVMQSEWRLQRGDEPLGFIAIVDEAPETQYLYPEFLLYRQLFLRNGVEAAVCDPRELSREAGRLSLGGRRVDMVYNRLTDFSLGQPEQEVVRDAYVAGEVVMSPHPRVHALYADKRNLVVLGDPKFLTRAGASTEVIEALSAAVPPTMLVNADNRDALWERRRELFFLDVEAAGLKVDLFGPGICRQRSVSSHS